MFNRRFIRRFKTSCIRNLGFTVTAIAFLIMGLVIVSTFITSFSVWQKTVVKVSIHNTITNQKLYLCQTGNGRFDCRQTGITKSDIFNKNDTNLELHSNAYLMLNKNTDIHIDNFCKAFYSRPCSKDEISKLEDKFLDLSYRAELKDMAMDIIYSASAKLTGNGSEKSHICILDGEEIVDCNISTVKYSITSSPTVNSVYSGSTIAGKAAGMKMIDSYIKYLKEEGRIMRYIDLRFLTNTNSVYPELAGIKDAVYGTFMTILICMFFSVIIGSIAALYIEEFMSKKSILRRIMIINIGNMSAIPSIIYGLLGAVLYIKIFQLPRSSIIVGSLTLSLMVFPMIVISARNAIMSVPKDIKDLARSMGSSEYRVAFFHTLPMALKGIVTGSLLTIGKAAGETSCMIIIGLTAFNTEVPTSIFDKTATISTQVYTWLEMPDGNFRYRIYAGMSVIILISFSISFIVRTMQAYWKSGSGKKSLQ